MTVFHLFATQLIRYCLSVLCGCMKAEINILSYNKKSKKWRECDDAREVNGNDEYMEIFRWIRSSPQLYRVSPRSLFMHPAEKFSVYFHWPHNVVFSCNKQLLPVKSLSKHIVHNQQTYTVTAWMVNTVEHLAKTVKREWTFRSNYTDKFTAPIYSKRF